MTNSWRKTLILNGKTPRYAPARVAQITTKFLGEMLILEDKTPKFGFALEAQIMTNFWRKILILTLKRLNLLAH